ncbi:Down syndrome cell adhesion molecule-like protein Dscam2, partial [Nilaparvata lugens]|uniref:Down syndrome cell adhesion molecule-like protein Dscam2 n=1 Tax=Nilaparvata lugens TaxID=108931 RepID=UPI00193E1DDD
EGTHKKILSSTAESHETIRLQEEATYQFWVTASTSVGEGESTQVVTITPTNKVPARITSFSQRILTPWKRNISLLCRKVGSPTPNLVWKLHNKTIQSNGRHE